MNCGPGCPRFELIGGEKILICPSCPEFKKLSPFGKIGNFWYCFMLLSNEYNDFFKKEGPGVDGTDWTDEKRCIFQGGVATLFCDNKIKEDWKLNLFSYKNSVRNLIKLINHTDDSEKSIIVPYINYKKRKKESVSVLPYFNESMINSMTEEQAKVLCLFDLENYRKGEYEQKTVLEVDLNAPLKKVEKEFKAILKKIYKEKNENILRQNERLNTPPFDSWRTYIISYMLREKEIEANWIDADWPNKVLTRPEIAELLFNGNQQSVDYAVREAKALIGDAVIGEGHFKNCNFYNTGACYS